MACPHCGDRMLSPVGRKPVLLVCCGCGRPRPRGAYPSAAAWFRARGPAMVAVVMLLPLALGMARLDEMRVAARAGIAGIAPVGHLPPPGP